MDATSRSEDPDDQRSGIVKERLWTRNLFCFILFRTEFNLFLS